MVGLQNLIDQEEERLAGCHDIYFLDLMEALWALESACDNA